MNRKKILSSAVGLMFALSLFSPAKAVRVGAAEASNGLVWNFEDGTAQSWAKGWGNSFEKDANGNEILPVYSEDLKRAGNNGSLKVDVNFKNDGGWNEANVQVPLGAGDTAVDTSKYKKLFYNIYVLDTITAKLTLGQAFNGEWNEFVSWADVDFSAAKKAEINGKSYYVISKEVNITGATSNKQLVLRIGVNKQGGYDGPVYIDNIGLATGDVNPAAEPAEKGLIWNFDTSDSAAGWYAAWGTPAPAPTDAAYSEDLKTSENKGALKLNVKFSGTGSFDEINASVPLAADKSAVNVSAYKSLAYDVYVPAAVTGSLQLGSAFNTAWDHINNYGNLIDLSKAEKVTINGASYSVIHQTEAPNSSATSKELVLRFASKDAKYTGPIYVDNVKLLEAASNGSGSVDPYVTPTKTPAEQRVVQPSDLTIPAKVKLVDTNATNETAALYAYLRGIGASKYVIFGHQNDTHRKAVPFEGDTGSDSKDVTGSISGIVGIDVLSLVGNELTEKVADPVTASANISIEAAKQGAIVTLSAHMPNFATVAANRAAKGNKGIEDFAGYTPQASNEKIMNRIMPGGDLNSLYTEYLDIIVKYAKLLEAQNVPVLFRPFHENSGDWFWWGVTSCDETTYKNAWRYTVEYLRDTKHVNNFLYVYSPNGPITSEEFYLSRYPGDDYVDVMGFDYYHFNAAVGDTFIEDLTNSMKVIDGLAAKHNKLTAVAETGVRYNTGDGVQLTDNKRPDWYKEVLNAVSSTNMAFFLTWADWGPTSTFLPYMVSPTKGHVLVDNFIDFYNEDASVFADGIGNYKSISVAKEAAGTVGYLTAPVSGKRILEPTQVSAKVVNANNPAVKFVLKAADGTSVSTLNAAGNANVYTAQISQVDLDKLGETKGTIDMYIGDKLYDSVSVLFNIAEEVKDPTIADNFESYLGDDSLLAKSWSTNAGGGSVVPKLTTDASQHNNGNYGLAFNYKLKGKPNAEGYAGVIRQVGADWSAFDAIQMWVKPDGKGQKLIIQIGSGGEEFEVNLSQFAATTEAKLLTIPFSQFKGKNNGTFKPSDITKVAIYCNTIVPEGQTEVNIDSTIYFDDIKGVKMDADKPVVSTTDAGDLADKVKAAPAGSKVVYTPADDSKIPAEAITAAKDNKDTVVIAKDNNKVAFEFSDSAVLDAMDNADFQLKVEALNNDAVKAAVAKDNANILAGYKFTNNLPEGKFGGNVTVKFNVGKTYAGKTVYLYYVDANNKFDKVNSAVVSEDGVAQFTITHFSDYVVVDKELVAAVKLPKTGSMVDESVLLSLGAAMIAAGALFFVFSRRKQRV